MFRGHELARHEHGRCRITSFGELELFRLIKQERGHRLRRFDGESGGFILKHLGGVA